MNLSVTPVSCERPQERGNADALSQLFDIVRCQEQATRKLFAWTGISLSFWIGCTWWLENIHLPLRGFLSAGMAVIITIVAFGLSIQFGHRQLKSIEELDKEIGCEQLGQIIDVLDCWDYRVRRIASKILCSQLACIRCDQCVDVNGHQFEVLNSKLFEKDDDLVLSILKSYRFIGSASCFEAVQSLILRKPNCMANTAIQKAAFECLPNLQAVAEREIASKTLLRHSANTDMTCNMLLRVSYQGRKEENSDTLPRLIDEPPA